MSTSRPVPVRDPYPATVVSDPVEPDFLDPCPDSRERDRDVVVSPAYPVVPVAYPAAE